MRPADVLSDVRRALGTGDERVWDGILVTPRVRNVVLRAEGVAERDEAVEPRHLFDAVLAEEGGLAADVLGRHGNMPASGRVGG